MNELELIGKMNKLRNIESVVFETNLQEILTSMEIVLTMFQVDSDMDIVKGSKAKLMEGLELLKALGQNDKLKQFELQNISIAFYGTRDFLIRSCKSAILFQTLLWIFSCDNQCTA